MSSFFDTVTWTMVRDLVIAAFLGGVIGLERTTATRPAGLRTYMLVSVGSCLFTLLSIHGFPMQGSSRDTARVAAQIVSGVGFLGVGAIWRAQDTMKGLTTAAGLWVAAAIGMAAGTGFGLLALVATILVLIILSVLHRFEVLYIEKVRKNTNSPSTPPTAAGPLP